MAVLAINGAIDPRQYGVIVERTDELARLQAQAQRRKSMLVFGPEAVGKTRLLRGFVQAQPLALFAARVPSPRELLLALIEELRREIDEPLFDRARAGYQDVYQPPGALLTIGTGSHMEDTDHGAKQIGGVKVSSHIAALFRMLHQFIDRSLDQAARTFIEPGRTSDNAVESGRNDVLCRDVVDKQQHPASQGFDRGHRRGELASSRGQLFHFTPVDGFDQRVSRGKMPI